jgi:hypothetical protein
MLQQLKRFFPGIRFVMLAAVAYMLSVVHPAIAKACWYCSYTMVGPACFPAMAGLANCNEALDYYDGYGYLCTTASPDCLLIY